VKNYSAGGVHLGYYRRRNPQALHEAHAELMRFYAEGKIRPRIFEVCSFEDLPRAMALVENRSVLGKVVLDVSGEGGSNAA
jgi:NADPH2:quinone reductase